MSATSTSAPAPVQAGINPMDPQNIANIADALNQSKFPCSPDGIKQIAQAFANAGLFVVMQGKPGPPGWTNLGPAGNYVGFFNGPPQEWGNRISGLQQQMQNVCQGANAGVTLYVDCGPGGKSVQVGPGDYAQIDKTGMPNDQLSALVVNPGTTVTIFQDYNFGGAQATWALGPNAQQPLVVPCLVNVPMNKSTSWNDQASSIKVSISK
jgi:hypothetical protein